MDRTGYEGQDMYRELTLAGVTLCALMGIILEAVILFVLGLQISQIPVVVLVFLWFLSGMLFSGILITAAVWQDRRMAKKVLQARAQSDCNDPWDPFDSVESIDGSFGIWRRKKSAPSRYAA